MPPSFRLVKSTGDVVSDIHTLDEWRAASNRRQLDQMVEGHSAYEVALAWADPPRVPAEVASLLARAPLSATVESAMIERTTRFDPFGTPRFHDLLLFCRSPRGSVVVGVEAKVNESFGATVAGELRKVRPANTRFPARLDALAMALFGRALVSDAYEGRGDGVLRFQLLTAIAGTLVEAGAAAATAAVVLVQEFETFSSHKSSDTNSTRAMRDVLTALHVRGASEFEAGVLAGPFTVHGNDLIPTDLACYMAKVRSTDTENPL